MTWWIVGIFQLLFFLLRQIIDLYFVRRIYIKREREREREREEGRKNDKRRRKKKRNRTVSIPFQLKGRWCCGYLKL
jgi:hypothetical protein